MRWLILILLFSCGKNKNTIQSKISDIDGDQILDSQEASGLDKFIAQVDMVPEIKGTIYNSKQQKNGTDLGIRISSVSKIKEQSLLLLINSQKSNVPPFFFEQKTLNLETQNGIQLESSLYTDLELVFDQSPYKPIEVLLQNGVTTKSLGEWQQHMQISLSQEEYNNVLLKKSTLSLKFDEQDAYYNLHVKKNDEIESKTYRIFYFDENIAKTIYISKQIPFLDFIERYGVTDAKDINLSRPVHLMEKNIIKSWWYKKIDQKNYVIGKVSTSEMINFKEMNTKKITGIINRIDGESKEKFIINFQNQNTIRLKIRGEIATRHFTLTSEDIQPPVSNSPCKYYFRNVIEDQPRPIQRNDLNAISIYQDGNIMKLNELPSQTIKEKNDDLGFYFEVEFITNAKEMSFMLEPLMMGQKLVYGVYQNTCDQRNISNEIFIPEKSYQINLELNAVAY